MTPRSLQQPSFSLAEGVTHLSGFGSASFSCIQATKNDVLDPSRRCVDMNDTASSECRRDCGSGLPDMHNLNGLALKKYSSLIGAVQLVHVQKAHARDTFFRLVAQGSGSVK